MSIHVNSIKRDIKKLKEQQSFLVKSRNRQDMKLYKYNQTQIENLKLKLQELENEVQNV